MNEYLTINEVAAVTRRSRQWVYDRIEDGTFGVTAVGSKTYVTTEFVRKWLDAECRSLEETLRHYYDQLEEVLV